MTLPPLARAATLALLLAAPLCAAEHLDREPLRATILDRTCLDRVSVDPLRGALSYARRDLVLGEGPDRFDLTRHWAPEAKGAHGAGWSSLLDARLELDEEGQPFLFQDETGVLQLLEAHQGAFRSRFGRLLRVEAVEGGWRLLGRQRGEVLRFGAQGRLLEASRYGHLAWTLSRDGQGRVQRVRGVWGELQLVYEQGRLLEVRGAGQRLRYGYEHERLVEAARGLRFARYGYDAEGRLSQLARGQGVVRYDEAGRVLALGGAGRVAERYAYQREGETLRVERTRNGERTRWQVSEARIVTILPTGGAEAVDLDARGRPVRRARGDLRWSWSYDEQGRLVARTTPRGTWHLRGFKDFAWGSDAPQEVVLPSGAALRFRYDEAGRVVGMADPARGKTLLKRDEAGRVVAVRHPHGAVDRRSYDARGYLVEVRREGLPDTRVERAADGSPSAIVTGARRVSFRQDAGGRLLREEEHGRLVREVFFGPRERTRWLRDAKRGTTHYRWDLAGRLVSARDEAGQLLRAGYDEAGRLSALRDAAGNTVRYHYLDARRVRIDDPSAGVRLIERDAFGLVRRELRGADELRYTYERGRLVGRRRPGGVDRFGYDALGRLTRLEGPAGGLKLSYDEAGRVERLEHLGARQALVVRYDARTGSRSALELPWGTIRYAYDRRGRLAAVRTPAGETIRCERDAEGERSALRFPNGVVTRYEREAGLLRRVETRRGEELLSLRAYAYDAAGRPNAVRDETGATLSVERDARGRVVAVREGQDQTRYVYDAADNRGGAGVEVAAGNRLRTQGELKLSYDARGALTAIEGPEGTRRFRYDVDGHLVQAKVGARTVRYGYAPNGLRLWREEGGQRTNLLSDGLHLLGELSGGKVQRSYVHGDEGVDELLAARVGEEQLYVHQDQLQSVVALSDAEGQCAARFSYGAFGETRQAEGPAAASVPFRYTGRELDPVTGLYDYRARSYAPELGRFTSPDPSGRQGGLNLYAYVLNDPLRFVDPYGLSAESPEDATAFAAFEDFGFWDLLDLGRGFREGIEDAIRGLIDVAFDLEGTWDTIRRAFRNPREFIEEIARHYIERWQEIRELARTDPDAFFHEIGRLAGEVAVGVALGGVVGVSARALAVARAVNHATPDRVPGDRTPGGDNDGLADRIRNPEGCFLAGTLVHTRRGPRPIEALRVGDEVLSRDELSGEQGYKPIVRLFRGDTQEVVTLKVAQVPGLEAAERGPEEQRLRCTREHPFWVRGAGWLLAEELAAGDVLRAESGADLIVVERTIRAEAAAHYNFEVADWHTYFVSQGGQGPAVWVHNDCRTPNGFASAAQFGQFGNTIHSRLQRAGFPDTQAYMQGSSVTGQNYHTGRPFGPHSDYDIALAGPDIAARARELGINLDGNRSSPLTAAEIDALGLTDMRDRLSRMSDGREINFMIYGTEGAVTNRGPSLRIPRRTDGTPMR